jgi:hypothetical protein
MAVLTTTAAAMTVGDPHIHGGDGDLADMRGRDNTWYVFLSTHNTSVSVHFMLDKFSWRQKTIYGSWMKGVAIVAHVDKTSIAVKAIYKAEIPTTYSYVLGNELLEGRVGNTISLAGIHMRLAADLTFSFSNGAWLIEAKNRFLPYKHKNDMKRRIDLTMKPIGDHEHEPVSPHGIIGQTFDHDNKMVLGKMDDYNIPSNVIVTRAQAEGAIEGTAADYEIDPANPFSTAFKFSRFGRTGRVPPRNVSALSGVVLASKKGAAAAAGVLNDEPDA